MKRKWQRISVGQRFGKLVVLALGEKEGGSYRDFVHCDCGTEKRVWRMALQSGDVTSCGCVLKEWQTTGWKKKQTRHGMSRSKLYLWWMNHRRAGTLCEAWAKDFVLFLVGIGGQNRMDDEGMQLFRPDDGQPWSNTNFQWIRSE